MCKQEKHFGWS